MVDHLALLTGEAMERIEDGYYAKVPVVHRQHYSLKASIENSSKKNRKNAVITEIKYASPSQGQIRQFESATRIAKEMAAGGACALSVLTASGSFGGDPAYLAEIAKSIDLPILMKDIIISPVQLEAASKIGADAVVLIAEVYSNGLSAHSLPQIRRGAAKLGLEVVLETCSQEEFSTLPEYKPEVYGVNNRNLSNLKVNLETTINILSTHTKPLGAPLISESGIETSEDIRRLRSAGADGFLIGTSIMRAEHIENKVRELVNT